MRVRVGLGVLVGCGIGVFVGGLGVGVWGGNNVLVGCEVGAMEVLVGLDVDILVDTGCGVAVFPNRWQSGSARSIKRSPSSSNVLKQYSLLPP